MKEFEPSLVMFEDKASPNGSSPATLSYLGKFYSTLGCLILLVGNFLDTKFTISKRIFYNLFSIYPSDDRESESTHKHLIKRHKLLFTI
jgi:hypothetical protein